MIRHLVFDGVAEGALGVGVDVVATAGRLARARLAPAPIDPRSFEQRVVSIDGNPVRSGAGRTIHVDGSFGMRGLGRGDVVVVPGLTAVTEASVDRMLTRAATIRGVELLRRASSRGATVAASCSGTFVLAATGLLDGRSATTTWWLAPAFGRRFPGVDLRSDRMVIEDHDVLTAGSAFAHADLMLALVARLGGPALAHSVAQYLVLDERASQSRYMVLDHLRTTDPALRAVERFVAANIGRRIGVGELAKAAATSPRTLARRMHAGLGMTPLEFVHRMRAQHAAHLLATTRASVDDVAARVGYGDVAAFRRIYRRVTGVSPRNRTDTGPDREAAPSSTASAAD